MGTALADSQVQVQPGTVRLTSNGEERLRPLALCVLVASGWPEVGMPELHLTHTGKPFEFQRMLAVGDGTQNPDGRGDVCEQPFPQEV